MKLRISGTVIAAAFACVLAFSPDAGAQDFPTKPITLVVPYPAGGQTDIIARIVARRLEEGLRQTILIDNKPGAGGIPATEQVVRAAHDGYTLLVGDMQQWAIAPATFKKLPFDPAKDLAGVTIVAFSDLFLIVEKSMGVSNLKDFIAKVKANPGKFQYGSNGVAGFHHLTMESFKKEAGLDIVHIAYRGGAPVVAALAAGEINMALQAWAFVKQLQDQGKIDVLAIASVKRAAIAPGIPTFAELGVPNVDFPPAIGIVTGAGVRPEILEKLSAAFAKAINHPDTLEQFKGFNMTPVANSPAETKAWMMADLTKLAAAVKAAGLEPQ